MRIPSSVSFILLACLARAQEPSRPRPATGTVTGAVVSGTVRDSISHVPLAGAIIQLAVAQGGALVARTAMSDSAGRFTIADVPQGHHTVGFLHPLLDSLGLEPLQREIVVAGTDSVRLDLSTPSPDRLRRAVCAAGGSPGRTLIIGFARDASAGAPLGNVQVTAQWTEISLGAGMRPVRRTPRFGTTTAANGWFAICDAPSTGSVILAADRGADSTDLIEVQLPENGVLRRDMYLGSARARLSGRVTAVVGGQPLPGAVVGIGDSTRTRTNERGEWTLSNVRSGTRVLEVRSVGYYPVRRAVDVVTDAAPVAVAMPTLKAMLDTVRITAARLADRYKSGFEERRRTGLGRYITPEDIQRRGPLNMSQVLRMVPGIRIDRSVVEGPVVYDSSGAALPQNRTADNLILLRASADDWCYPAIYVNGHYMRDLDADDLDVWVRPHEILGIEVYPGISAPVQFQQGMSGCGSILIWTKS
jgi:hypothetical protein